MSLELKSFRKNFFVLLTGNSVGQLIPFFLAPFIGRLFSPEQLAIQENFLAIVAMISIVACGRYETALVLPASPVKANNLAALGFLISIVVACLSFISYFFRDRIALFYANEEFGSIMLFVALAVFLLALNNLLSQWTIRAGNYKLLTSSRVMQSGFQNAGYVLFGYLGWGIKGLIAAWLIGSFITNLLLLFPGWKSFRKEDVTTAGMKEVAKEYKDFPMVNSIHAFTDIFATQFLLFWLITNKYGALALGLFAVMTRYVRSPLNIVGGAVGQLYYREATVTRNNKQSLIPIFNKSVTIVAVITLPAILVLLLFGPDLFALYLGEKWRAAGEYARIMAPAIFFNFICSPVSSTTLIFNKQREAYLFSTVGYIVSLGLLFSGARMGLSFEQSLWMYSLSLSALYIALYTWYRKLVNITIHHEVPL